MSLEGMQNGPVTMELRPFEERQWSNHDGARLFRGTVENGPITVEKGCLAKENGPITMEQGLYRHRGWSNRDRASLEIDLFMVMRYESPLETLAKCTIKKMLTNKSKYGEVKEDGHKGPSQVEEVSDNKNTLIDCMKKKLL